MRRFLTRILGDDYLFMLNAEKLSNIVVNAMEDRKALDIKVLDVRGMSDIADWLVIASGTSNRQVVAIAHKIVEDAKQQGHRPLGMEGEDSGEWVLVDLGDVVAHVMQPTIRDFYQLEKLWSPVQETTAIQA